MNHTHDVGIVLPVFVLLIAGFVIRPKLPRAKPVLEHLKTKPGFFRSEHHVFHDTDRFWRAAASGASGVSCTASAD